MIDIETVKILDKSSLKEENTPPAQEEKQEEKVETPPTPPADTPPAEPTKVELSDEEIEKIAREKGFLKAEEASQYRTDLAKRLDELAANGVEINTETLTKAFEDLSRYDVKNANHAIELVRRKLAKEYDADEVDLVFVKKYGDLSELDPTDEEYKIALIELKKDAKSALESLKKEQEELAIPKEPKLLENKLIEDYLSKAKKEAEDYQKQVAEYQSNLAKEVVKLTDKLTYQVQGEDIEFEITPELKKTIQEDISNLGSFFTKHFVKTVDGKPAEDKEALLRFMVNFHAQKDLTETIAGRFKSKGGEDLLKNKILNKTPDSGRKTGTEGGQYSSIYEEAAIKAKIIPPQKRR